MHAVRMALLKARFQTRSTYMLLSVATSHLPLQLYPTGGSECTEYVPLL